MPTTGGASTSRHEPAFPPRSLDHRPDPGPGHGGGPSRLAARQHFHPSFIDNRTGAATLDNYARVLGRPFFQTALLNSLIVGCGGMLGALLLGIPLAVLTTRYVIYGRNLLSTFAVLALVSPPFIGAYAWIMMLGRNGFVRQPFEEIGIELPSIYSFFGITLPSSA